MQRGRNFLVLQRQNRLYQPGNAGSRLQVAEIGLYRSDGERAQGITFRREYVPKGPHLDRITKSRARTVTLNHIHLAR